MSADGFPSAVAEALDHLGRLRFDQYVELALYAPASGFFATEGRAGRRGGDFITSPEVGPLFGAVVASRLDRLWEDLGRPDPFTVVEAGAGRGALAISVRAARPACGRALHWVMVERSAALRSLQGEHLDLRTGPSCGPAVPSTPGPSPGSSHPSGPGPHFSQATALPEAAVVGAVVANELLDNLPFRLLERRGGRWMEVWVDRAGGGADRGGSPAEALSGAPVEEVSGAPVEELAEVLVEVPDADRAEVERLVPDAPDGARVPWQPAAAGWVAQALEAVERGLVLVFDYCRPTAELADLPQGEWLRTYRAHERGNDPLDGPGGRDITVDVALDQLPGATSVGSQADWLAANGIDALVEAARHRWEEQAAVGDLESLRARSVPVEAEALCDPTGLGSFTVMEWTRPPSA